MDDARAGLRRRALGDEEEPGAEARPDRRTPGLDWEPRRRSDDDGRGVVAASRLAYCPPGVPYIGDLSRSRTSCDAISPRDASAPSEGRRPPGGRGLARRLAPFAFDQREDTAGGQSVAVPRNVKSSHSVCPSLVCQNDWTRRLPVPRTPLLLAHSRPRASVRALASRVTLASTRPRDMADERSEAQLASAATWAGGATSENADREASWRRRSVDSKIERTTSIAAARDAPTTGARVATRRVES